MRMLSGSEASEMIELIAAREGLTLTTIGHS